MSGTSSIEWTDTTWNPTVGCTKVSPGCKNCYAEKMHARLRAMGQAKYKNGFDFVRPHTDHLDMPLRWRKPRRVFVNSMSDLFHESLDFRYISAVFGVMAAAPQHQFQVLTKRADVMREWVDLCEASADGPSGSCVLEAREWIGAIYYQEPSTDPPWPLPNVWLGVSVEDQERADERIPHLLKMPAAVRFLSCEPLLGPLDFGDDFWESGNLVDWVIVGAESGPGARPMELDWARSIVQQCKDAAVPVFVKQLCHNGRKIPFDGWPDDLKVRQFPKETR